MSSPRLPINDGNATTTWFASATNQCSAAKRLHGAMADVPSKAGNEEQGNVEWEPILDTYYRNATAAPPSCDPALSDWIILDSNWSRSNARSNAPRRRSRCLATGDPRVVEGIWIHAPIVPGVNMLDGCNPQPAAWEGGTAPRSHPSRRHNAQEPPKQQTSSNQQSSAPLQKHKHVRSAPKPAQMVAASPHNCVE